MICAFAARTKGIDMETDAQLIEDWIAASAWVGVVRALRSILLDAGLTEERKWRKPCYGMDGGNIAIIQSFKDDCRLMFFKGILLADPEGLLTSQGENTQGALVVRLTSVEEVAEKTDAIRALIAAAVKVEKSGEQVAFTKRHDFDLPQELVDALDDDPDLAAGWAALTPGRQRSWVLQIASAKQSETRAARVAKAAPAIKAGKGWNEQ